MTLTNEWMNESVLFHFEGCISRGIFTRRGRTFAWTLILLTVSNSQLTGKSMASFLCGNSRMFLSLTLCQSGVSSPTICLRSCSFFFFFASSTSINCFWAEISSGFELILVNCAGLAAGLLARMPVLLVGMNSWSWQNYQNMETVYKLRMTGPDHGWTFQHFMHFPWNLSDCCGIFSALALMENDFMI